MITFAAPASSADTHQPVVEARSTPPALQDGRGRLAHRALDVVDRLTDRHRPTYRQM